MYAVFVAFVATRV